MTQPVSSADIADALERGPDVLYDVFRRRFEPGVSHEDPPLDAPLLGSATRMFEEAAAAALAGQRPGDRARALIGLGCAHASTNSIRTLEQAERALVEALHALSAEADRALAVHAYLTLLDVLVRVVDAVGNDKREPFIERALGFAHAAEYLAMRGGDDHARACALADECTLLAERFRGDRDRNLMDAVAAGERALALLTPELQKGEIRWPLLLLHMANASVKVEPERGAWLQRGGESYARGRTLVDTSRYPELARLLDGNATVYRDQTEEQRKQLPPKEMYARYSSRVDLMTAAGDRDAALATASEMVAWAYALPDQPNAYVGHAHVLVGRTYLSFKQWKDAREEFERGLTALMSVFAPNEPGYRYVRDAAAFRERALSGERGT